MRFFHNKLVEATYRTRPHRFCLECDLNGSRVEAYLPNPGRLWELLFVGAKVWLEQNAQEGRKMDWTAVAIEREGRPVVLHTHKMNAVARYLLENREVPGLEGTTILGSEVRRGHSRFDFLLCKGEQQVLLEVKSCTLFSQRVAMFPDAVTERGKRHLQELAALCDETTRAAVLFIVNAPHLEFFLPDYHTDLDFAQTLVAVRHQIGIIPLAIGWNNDLTLQEEIRLLPVPWDVLEREAHDSGAYLVLLHLAEPRVIAVGALGQLAFLPGYYLYVGSARQALSRRIERHRRLRKNMHWHIDYLRDASAFSVAIPILNAEDLECQLAQSLQPMADESIPGFGCSDCACSSHLFRFHENPLHNPTFHQFLQYYRMDRLATRKLANDSS